MKKILLIEDDPFLVKLYAEIFTDEGYNFDSSVGGVGGLEKVKVGKPDLIILDIMIPEMNGLDVLDKLKADSATKEIPVLILTNLSSKEEEERALKAGALKYLIKTQYEPEKLIQVVKQTVPPE
ncbi:MAG TPA: response regulator [Candidatus Nanoarchaeia archaeon]